MGAKGHKIRHEARGRGRKGYRRNKCGACRARQRASFAEPYSADYVFLR
jgi:hypothetical protein